MLTLDLPPSVEQQIISNAHAQNLSVSEYVLRHLPVQKTPNKQSMRAVAGILEGRLEEALAFQKQLRDEWD